MLGSAEDFAEPQEAPAPLPRAGIHSRGASQRGLSNMRPTSLSYLPDVLEGGVSQSDALESHRDAMARRKAVEDRLQHAAASRAVEATKKQEALKGLLPHERTKLLKEDRIRQRWLETQKVWAGFRTRVAKKLGRSESQLVVAHADEFR